MQESSTAAPTSSESYVKVAVKSQVVTQAENESKETKKTALKELGSVAPSPAQSLATLKTLIAKAAAGTLKAKNPSDQSADEATSNRSSISPSMQTRKTNTGSGTLPTGTHGSTMASPKSSPPNQRSTSSLSSNSASTQASYEEPAKSQDKGDGLDLKKSQDVINSSEREKPVRNPLPAHVSTSTSTGTSTGTDPEPIEKCTLTDNDYWQEEKVKMENTQSYQSFQKGSILKKNLTSTGTSPPPQTISTQV